MLTPEESKKLSQDMRSLLAVILLSSPDAINLETAAVRAGISLFRARSSILLLLTGGFVQRQKSPHGPFWSATDRPEVLSEVAEHVCRAYKRIVRPDHYPEPYSLISVEPEALAST